MRLFQQFFSPTQHAVDSSQGLISAPVLYSLEWAAVTDSALASINLSV